MTFGSPKLQALHGEPTIRDNTVVVAYSSLPEVDPSVKSPCSTGPAIKTSPRRDILGTPGQGHREAGMIQPGTFGYSALERVHFGKPAAETVAAEAERQGAHAVFLMVSGTLDRETDEVDRLRHALGTRYAGSFDRMPPHTPREAVIECAAAARAAGADLLVTFGGGSLTDGGKVVAIALEHGVTDVAGLEAFRVVVDEKTGVRTIPPFRAPSVRQVAVPTTLSAGDFQAHAGCTDTRVGRKQGYRNPGIVPVAVVLDPAPTVHTPEWLWLSTGIRAFDHCVEGLCSIEANPYSDGAALQGLRLLSEGLPDVKRDPADLDARLKCQIGAWLSMTGVQAGVSMGGSHAIGHVLGGTAGVPHGYTSCVMLPNVLRWNAGVNADRQALVSAALGRPGEPAADVVGEFIAGLGLPRRLADVGVEADRFDLIAETAMHDPWTHTNPRKIDNAAQVREILEMAA